MKMDRPTRIESLAAAALLALALTSCAPVRINSYSARGVDFPQYRTYAWDPADALSTGDPRLDNNRFFSDRVEKAVDYQLASRGFEKRESGAADVLIHMYARLDQRIESDAIDGEYARCDVSDCRPFVYDAGTLLLDFIDTRTNKLAWRGWAEGGFDGAIDNQDWMEARIDDVVAKILARLPRDTSRNR
jgi:Domain of unknown function (DUF4136)